MRAFDDSCAVSVHLISCDFFALLYEYDVLRERLIVERLTLT